MPEERLTIRRSGELIPHSATVRQPSANLRHALRAALGPPPGVSIVSLAARPTTLSTVGGAVGVPVGVFELLQLI